MKKTGFYWQPRDTNGRVWHLRNANHIRIGIVLKTLDNKEAMGCTSLQPSYRLFQNMSTAADWVVRNSSAGQ